MRVAAARILGRPSGRANMLAPRPEAFKRSTKDVLIETAEQLFGRHGIDGISLREIALAAGQANSNAVQYHFKDKSGLVSAILNDRVYRIEALRRERLEKLAAGKRSGPRDLLAVIWLPILSIRGADGSHTFCRFLLQYMLQPNVAQHPLLLVYKASRKSGAKDLPCLVKATRLLRAHYEHVPQAVYGRRLSALSMMFMASVVEFDNARLSGKGGVSAQFDIEPILDMSIGALSAPA